MTARPSSPSPLNQAALWIVVIILLGAGGALISGVGNTASDLESARSGLLVMVFGSCLGLGRLAWMWTGLLYEGQRASWGARLETLAGVSCTIPLQWALYASGGLSAVFGGVGAITALVSASRLLRESRESSSPSKGRTVAIGLVVVGVVGLGVASQAETPEMHSPAGTLEANTPLRGDVIVLAPTPFNRFHSAFSLASDSALVFTLDPAGLGEGVNVQRFGCFGEDVRSPVPGEVIRLEDTFADRNSSGAVPEVMENPLGNHLWIRTADEGLVGIGNLKKGSLQAEVGQQIRAGERIGHCGLSGAFTEPMVFLVTVDGADPPDALAETKGPKVILNELHGVSPYGFNQLMVEDSNQNGIGDDTEEGFEGPIRYGFGLSRLHVPR